MGVPEKYRKGFELGKYYGHFGKSQIHIIAETKESDMYHIDYGQVMFIGEERSGGLKPITSDITGCTGYFEISKEIFIEALEFKEYKFGEIDKTGQETFYSTVIVPRFFMHTYPNGEIYLFDLLNHYDEDGLQPNILKNDYNNVFSNIKNHVTTKELKIIEKLIFERM
jgi:hypothetical protein